MKKVIMMLIVAAMMMTSTVLFAADDPHEGLFTDKLLNGRFLAGLPDETASVFVQGVIDGVGKVAPGTLSKIYPGSSREDVVVAVKSFYINNPDKLDRPVADVLMSGCK